MSAPLGYWVWIRKVDDPMLIGDGEKLIVSLPWLRLQGDSLVSVPVELGIELEASVAVEELLPYLDYLKIILLRFDSFVDGRAFSQARLLRERHAYRGNIRAVSDVFCDQLLFMRRCGFNQFLLSDNEDIEFAIKSFGEISLSDQNELKQAACR